MEHDLVEDAYAMLCGHTRGDLQFGEHVRPIRYVITHDGRLVAPVMVAMIQTIDCVLFVPEAVDGALEVMISLEELNESSEDGRWVDRWQIYHGEPTDVRWAFLDPDAAKHNGHVIDGAVLRRENPLATDESRLCKHMNEDHRDALRALCLHFAQIEINDPVMVGVDPYGIDVRGRFDVVRVNAIEPMPNADAVRQVLVQMTRLAGASA